MKNDRIKNGISSKYIFAIMLAITLVISLLLIQATSFAKSSNDKLQTINFQYIVWQKDASDLQEASDYLTEQVRCFAETGDRLYLDQYFEEANVTKRRDNAVEDLYGFVGDTQAYQSLVSAMNESVNLMDTEYYSMRLEIEACGYDLTTFPIVIQEVILTAEDTALSLEEKNELARTLVFNDAYHEQKLAISNKIQSCLESLEEMFDNLQTKTSKDLNRTLFYQRFLIAAYIFNTILLLTIVVLFILNPLLNSVGDIKANQQIKPKGFKEFRFFANTYNQIFNANKEQEQAITALLNNMPAMSFTKDVKTGIYLACNQAFAEYAHKENPSQVIGLTDVELFDEETAQHSIEDDKMAVSMDEPYNYFEYITDSNGNQRQLQTTKLKFVDSSGKMCVLGMCADVTNMVHIRRENAKTKDAYKKAKSTGIIYSHMVQTLAQNYVDLYYINLNDDSYIQYETDAKNDTLIETKSGEKFFQECKNYANQYIHPDDKTKFLNALDRNNLLKVLKKEHSFVLNYRVSYPTTTGEQEPKYVSMKISTMSDNKQCIIVTINDITEQMKQRLEAEKIHEERIAFSRINSLTGDFICVYVVNPVTKNYREYIITDKYKHSVLPKDGKDFFADAAEYGKNYIHPDDIERVISQFNSNNVMSEIKHSGIFTLNFRLIIDNHPIYAQIKAAIVNEQDGSRLIVGINNVDSQIKQKQNYEKRLALAQSAANIDALTSVKNRHAYIETENRINRQIEEHHQQDFAIVIFDVNDLKKINDTKGHKAGDKYLRDASRIICNIFKHSPVFRVGGDEFTVIARDDDYMNIDELINKMHEHNNNALNNGGIVIACGMSKYKNDICVASVFERADQKMYQNKRFLKGEIE